MITSHKSLAWLLPALLASAAAADVTVYGQLNVGLIFDRTTAVSQVKIDNLYLPSRLGFKGGEDLGDGMKAFFQIESRVNPDDAGATSFADREGWIGISGSFGKIGLGRGKSPYTNTSDLYDISDGAIGFGIWSVDTITNSGIGSGSVARINNSIRYDSPNLSGFTSSIMYGFGENKSNDAGKGTTGILSANAAYNADPFGVVGAYSHIGNANGIDGQNKNALLLGASYRFEKLKAQIGWQHGQIDKFSAGKDYKRDSGIATLVYDDKPFLWRAGIIQAGTAKLAGSDVKDSKFTQYVLGLKYGLSPRTNLLLEYVGRDIKVGNDPRALTLGMLHVF
ncbi:porin [Chitinimonas sp.]|uniref:porin n=1 Tax=Chitinimonas sp. TaxID=1934313 RepID=UPI0035B2655A